MAIIPVRELAKYGIITDMDPYDLPKEAWSFGVNVRFRNGKVSRAPVFRNVGNLSGSPRYVFSSNPASGLDFIFINYLTGELKRWQNGAETDYSITGFTPAATEVTHTSCSLGGVVYSNRADRVPWSFGPTDSRFQALANWSSTWRAQLLRTCGGALVALNVTKAGVTFPTMVKTSSIPLSGTVPVSWDQTLPNTLATENILADMQGQIIDANNFGNALAIYGLNETWLMTPDGSTQIYNYRQLPFKKGALNANCSVQIDGKHLVFGPDDIWTHDGYSETSLCNGTVRDFIFQNLNLSKANRCFVAHNVKLKEVHFCYVSADRGVSFTDQNQGCNRQAVYNYGNASPTWTFDDLPMVYAADNANLDTTLTYATVTETYASIGSTYADQDDGFKRTLCYVGSTWAPNNLTASLYAFDLYGPGSSVVFPVDTNATRPLQLEKDGIDLDGIGVDLRGYKSVIALYPQARLELTAQPLVFTMGSCDYFGGPIIYDTTQTYDGQALYKLDYRSAGRALGMKISYADYAAFTLTGIDYELDATGER
ncbi:hypothetical protein HU230_0012400 [Bradyrhizobium quebecense]|uniref:Uncharacterized protein n=1 Tax=Bradyrhizobium quebecense TaxID=2748629 RepID=A0A973WMQ1_9BRAD|nr:hypothetical protein [Bradyrhizobium quebecense]UGA46789.1 hypothetical protein HU230_0012400 [Bradyrhizobium quebecense]